MRIDAVYGAIGRFCARFWWIVIPLWLIAAFAASALLPSLSSVTQSNNTKFLPASAPSMHAAALAAPFGTTNLQPIPVVAARTTGPLTGADKSALTSLRSQMGKVATVQQVRDLGQSQDGHAEQLVVLATFGSGNPNQDTDLVNALRSKISRAGLPSGLQVHLAGDIAIQVDQQKASGNTGNQLESLSALFIIVLLVLIFRSLSLALTTLIPAFVAFSIAGPLVGLFGEHGLKVSPIAQLLLIVLVLGAGTDYGLFLVFRVREELRRGLGRQDAVVQALTRVGESITFSAATVIAALLTLLAATFSFYSQLGVPLAIGIVVMLISALTLLPALLSFRLAFIEAKRRLFKRVIGREELIPWSIQTRSSGGAWGRVAGGWLPAGCTGRERSPEIPGSDEPPRFIGPRLATVPLLSVIGRSQPDAGYDRKSSVIGLLSDPDCLPCVVDSLPQARPNVNTRRSVIDHFLIPAYSAAYA